MLMKILSIEGGGILGVKFLIGLLKISKEYDKRKIDLFNLFNVFTGVSTGAIIAAGISFRERILMNLLKRDERLFNLIMEKMDYDKKNWKDIKQKIILGKFDCSTMIIHFLIYLFKNMGKDIFVLNQNRVSVTCPKYLGCKKDIFKKYIDYDLKDLLKNRYLIIKTFNIVEMNINIFSNYGNSNGNKYSTNIAEIIDWSSNAPTFFPNNGIQIDGGNFINSAFYSEKKLFENQDLIIFSVGSKISKLKIPFLNDQMPIIGQLVNVAYNIGKQIDKIAHDRYYHLGFDFKNYQLDDYMIIDEIIEKANEIQIESAILFLDKYFLE